MSFEAVASGGAARSYLFAPGNNEKLLERVFLAGADAVVLDLEDAVPLQDKDWARDLVSRLLGAQSAGMSDASQGPAIYVRVNGLESGRTRDDILAVVSPALRGIRLPKAEDTDSVREVASWLAEAERSRGLTEGSVRLDCTIESARGLLAAAEIARVDRRVGALVFGHVDYCLDVGAEPGTEGWEILYARSYVVAASRFAGIPAPVDGAYTRLRDPEGLRRSALAAKRLGYFGKSAVHPEQLAIIHQVFTPTAEEVEAAQTMVTAYERAEITGTGAIRLDSGQFVDRAVVLRAYRTLALASRQPNQVERG